MREVPQPKTLPNQHGAGSRAGQEGAAGWCEFA